MNNLSVMRDWIDGAKLSLNLASDILVIVIIYKNRFHISSMLKISQSPVRHSCFGMSTLFLIYVWCMLISNIKTNLKKKHYLYYKKSFSQNHLVWTQATCSNRCSIILLPDWCASALSGRSVDLTFVLFYTHYNTLWQTIMHMHSGASYLRVSTSNDKHASCFRIQKHTRITRNPSKIVH